MKQRLAIAAALLKSPDLLILDEPTNGLDPAGIRGIRDLIRDLGESGVTVLLSSHILAEVQQVCHSVSIVGDGKLLASGRVEDLLGENVSRTRVGVTDPQGARHFLEAAGYTVSRQGDRWWWRGTSTPRRSPSSWPAKGVYVSELSAIRPDARVVLPQAHRTAARGGARDGRRRRRADGRGGLVMRLLAVELNRFRSRRAIALLMLAGGRAGRRARGRDRLEHPAAHRGRPPQRRRAGRPRGQAAGDPAGGHGLPRGAQGLPRPLGERRRVRGRTGPGPGGLLPARPAEPAARSVHRGSRARRWRSWWSA